MRPYNCAISLVKFRITNDSLPVNLLTFDNVEREDCISTLCECREIDDEFHYIFTSFSKEQNI